MNNQSELVLILDDDASVCKSLERFLASNSFNVQTFSTPDALLSSLPPSGPACLVLDLNLGQLDGFDVLKSLNEMGCICPVIFLTAYGDVSSAVRALQGGAEDFLTKPYDTDQLLSTIKRAMEKARKQWRTGDELKALRQRANRLTPREHEVISLVLGGLLNKQIADRLDLAEITVKIHRRNAMRRLGARTPGELAHFAGLCGFAPPPPHGRICHDEVKLSIG